MTPRTPLLPLLLFTALHAVHAAVPEVDFDRMGTVGLAGAFAGLDLFSNASVAFDPSTATLLSRAADGSLTRLASTNQGGSILAGCALDTTFYLAGSFSAIDSVPAANIASYTPASGAFAALASGGPNGQVNALFCDEKLGKVWAAGSFSSPGASVALFDPKAGSWSSAPFNGVSGAQAVVTSITTNASDASLFFAGSFLTSFGSGSVVLNGTNNPNVPFSAGASPFSSSLVPVPLQNADIDATPHTTEAGFDDIKVTLCPAGPDGSGNSWFAEDNSSPVINVRTFTFISALGVRLGNTFQANHGTQNFTVTTLPDNTVRQLRFLDPTTGQNVTCTDCSLSSDSSILYQDFLFDGSVDITGVQIKISSFTGTSAGLHILQLLSSGAFASSIPSNNTESCFAPNPSNSTQTGTWTAKVAKTDIPGTVQTVLVSDVDVGTAASAGPTFTWIPYVSAAGNYDINLLVPGCTNFQDCAARTTVKVTVFPGAGLAPFIQTVSQQNKEDTAVPLYSGPILPSSPDFVTTISMALEDSPQGNGLNGKWELVADRVQLVLTSANVTADGNSTTTTTAGSAGLARGFGFLEWPRASTTVDATTDGTKVLPNTTLTAFDALGFDVLAGLGGVASVTSSATSSARINAVAHHASGAILVGGAFNLTAGAASGASNLVAFKNGALASVASGGLNGPVAALVLAGDQLYVGGSFTDTRGGATGGLLGGIALYDVQKDAWTPLGAGLDGAVTSLGMVDGQLQVAGNFSTVQLAAGQQGMGMDAPGFAMWDIERGAWVNSGGFVSGALTLVVNGTSEAQQFVAGSVRAAAQFGASGFVTLKNGKNSDSAPVISPLAVGLSGSVPSSASASSASTTASVKRRHVPHLPSTSAWISHMKFSHLFARQTTTSSTSSPAQLPAALPAPAPAVLAGAYWTNSSTQITIIGGNFTFLPSSGPSSTPAAGVALYDASAGTVRALQGPQVNGTVRALLVDGTSLYVGGAFTLTAGDSTVSGLAVYDLAADAWALDGLQSLQGDSSGSGVVVRSITKSTLKPDLLMVAGTFAQAGSLRCQAICSWDTQNRQWNALGSGILGEVASVAYAGDNQNLLFAAGSIALSDNTASNVVQFSLDNTTWAAIGLGSDIPGPVSALEVNSGNASSVFAAGTTTDGASAFLAFWNGAKWTTLGSNLAAGTTVAQLTMVPLQNTHDANSVIESDRVLMITGGLSTAGGNASAALFDGVSLTPFVVSTSASGTPGSVAGLFRSLASFSFSKRKFLATGVVILISIAIAAGVVFLLALVGILWTLFSRKDDKLNKFDTAEDDDDSTHHRPSSLLEHINAATRTTIMGGSSPYGHYNADKELDAAAAAGGAGVALAHSASSEADPFGPDASNYIRAETPSDAVGGLLAEETSRPAHARYSFDGTGEGELPISSGAEVEVLDDRDPAWWYARDVRTGQEGVVPAAYLY